MQASVHGYGEVQKEQKQKRGGEGKEARRSYSHLISKVFNSLMPKWFLLGYNSGIFYLINLFFSGIL
ncbi:hypothetical protein ES332_A09G050700v1 [Gossypium tomentosum]|uniref:Uncharacterized protein n=1 Tax=Gossypium tomentosum TaxID=34277 RepID=A0A5D2P182_GOSTO|nr:hypothetical protein ES332_A09G050700v1 [Gossypium tomentosum]